MASNPYYAKCFQTDHHEDDDDDQKTHKELMTTFPMEKGLWHLPLRLYQGFWFPEATLPGVLALARHLPRPSPSDVFLVTFPKSGTTWLKALSFAIANRSTSSAGPHPLLTRHPQDCSPYLEGLFSGPRLPDLNALPSPRQLGTHIPYSVLPASVRDPASGCRIVYMCREPKDTLVSSYHFAEGIMGPEESGHMAMEDAVELFCKGLSAYGPVWEHQLEYWRESRRRPDKVLFLKYEDMKAEPEGNVMRLAEFIGAPFSAEEESAGAVEEMVRLCSFEKLRGLEVNRVGVRGKDLGWSIKNSAFFRKGKVGDWRDHLTPVMAERIDAITRDRLKGSGLTHDPPVPA